MAQVTASVQDYMTRLTELGEREDHINRFYIAINDDELREMEEDLIET